MENCNTLQNGIQTQLGSNTLLVNPQFNLRSNRMGNMKRTLDQLSDTSAMCNKRLCVGQPLPNNKQTNFSKFDNDNINGTTTSSKTEQSNNRIFSNHAAVTKSLAKLFNDPEHSDVIVHVGKQSFFLHRLLLLRSPVLRCMLLGRGWSESTKTEVHLEEDEHCAAHIEDVLRFMYSGEIQTNDENVGAFLVLANKYDLPDLEKFCECYASSQVFNGTDIDRILQWWLLSERLSLTTLFRKCMAYMLLNMDKVLRSELFLDIPLGGIMCLIREKDMVVESEYVIYTALNAWLNESSRQKNYLKNLKALSPYINFCMMSPDNLISIQKEMQSDTDALSVLGAQLLDAFRFHNSSFAARKTTDLSRNDLPRLYTGPSSPLQKEGQNSDISTSELSSPYCSTIRIKPEDREKLISGLAYKVSVQMSNSEADIENKKNWCLAFREVQNSLNLEISTTLGAKEDFGMVESSFLIYKHVQGVTFVKGVMQLRCPTRTLKENQSGHVFTMSVPSGAMEENSSYQIPVDKNGSETSCMFKIITRHYHDSILS